LIAADERIAARPRALRVESEPPPWPTAAGSGPKLYTADQQAWFRNTICNPFTPGGGSQWYGTTSIVACNQSYAQVGTNWQKGATSIRKAWSAVRPRRPQPCRSSSGPGAPRKSTKGSCTRERGDGWPCLATGSTANHSILTADGSSMPAPTRW
jgi:hypothetical protein